MLGTLNGLAQTLAAAGRATAPFVSGALFSVATNIRPKGELLAWGVFGGAAFIGFLISLGVKNPALEAELEDDEDEDGDEEEGDDKTVGNGTQARDFASRSARENEPLLSRSQDRAN